MQSSSQSRFFTFAASGSIFLFILAVFVFFLALLAGCSKQASGAPSPVSVEVARLETALAEKGFPSFQSSEVPRQSRGLTRFSYISSFIMHRGKPGYQGSYGFLGGKSAAERTARDVESVESVENEIEIAGR
ncbi:MAG: hypothetical protein A4E57_01236 [Syntrophorhabdaceae bacterium PtaU1.Bin034]|jgi:osmotically-inducible protein OsmY|nr:MAG: hypothetical protein A4E57_01236 [Syntrophorhabdaceae bacterium PtaU1.Bin034]